MEQYSEIGMRIENEDDQRKELEHECQMTAYQVRELTIVSDDDYARGSEILKEIKSRMKQVKDYWKVPKQAAQNAHKTIVARETQMLAPLEEAERVIKRAMLDYTAAIEKARREAEEAARAEEQRLLEMAKAAEEKGDEGGADFLRGLAETEPVQPIVAAPKTSGLSVKKTWKARVVNPQIVPAYFDGMEIRTINAAALNTIARESGGTAQIPGVEFYQDSTMSVRS